VSERAAVKPKLLIVEDDEELRTQMQWALAADYEVLLAGDRKEALRVLRESRPVLVTLDLGLPPRALGAEEGLAALDEIRRTDVSVKVVVVTGQAERELALRAVGSGAHDYFLKPIDVAELKVVLRRALHLQELERAGRAAETTADVRELAGMRGESAAMQAVFAAVRKVAPSSAAVLITGESGAGKELVARAIHELGPRVAGPFVAINCGAIPGELLESELFGHEKGAFTGAHEQRKGRLELAQGGTLFLDEIAELPLALQVKLLRVLQEQRMQRVGGRQDITVDARVLSATNRDVKAALAEGRFRDDLYYRLAVVAIHVPPLRERGGDVVLLARDLLDRHAGEGRKRVIGFAPDALVALSAHTWPGNVRELENRIRRAVVMAEGPRLNAGDLELAEPTGPGGPRLRQIRQTLERETIQKALARNGGNVSRTAAELGVSRPTLYDLMEKLGVSRP